MNPDASFQELDDWQLVCQLLPPYWQQQASLQGALRRARGFPNAAVLLRTLLVHLAAGCSLQETATIAQQTGWCHVSPVALFKRLRAAEQWLRWMAAIVPPLGLAQVMQRWKYIARKLADSPRKRKRQGLS